MMLTFINDNQGLIKLKQENILTGCISSVLVTLALSQVSYGSESSLRQQKVGNDLANSHLLSVQTKTSTVAMFIQHGKAHKLPTGKKGKKA